MLLSCNFINHFPDAEDVVSILTCCRKHLKENGCIILDCSAPDTDYLVKTNGKEEVLTFAAPNGNEIKDRFCPRYDLLNQIEEDTIRLEEWKDGNLLREACTEERLTWYYPREIRSLIREAGMAILWESDCLTPDGTVRPIGTDSCNMVFCCR